jgi:hypothetical protein
MFSCWICLDDLHIGKRKLLRIPTIIGLWKEQLFCSTDVWTQGFILAKPRPNVYSILEKVTCTDEKEVYSEAIG